MSLLTDEYPTQTSSTPTRGGSESGFPSNDGIPLSPITFADKVLASLHREVEGLPATESYLDTSDESVEVYIDSSSDDSISIIDVSDDRSAEFSPETHEETIIYDAYSPNVDLEYLQKIYLEWSKQPENALEIKLSIGGVKFYIKFKLLGKARKAYVSFYENFNPESLDQAAIIECDVLEDELFLDYFFYNVARKETQKVKPTQQQFFTNLLKTYFEVSPEKFDSVSLSDGNKDAILSTLNEIKQERGESEISKEQFELVSDYRRHFTSTGQRGMRLVHLIKEITQKPKVTLVDAWKGKWGVDSQTIKFLYTYFDFQQKFIESLRLIPSILKTEPFSNIFENLQKDFISFLEICRKPKVEFYLRNLPAECLEFYERRFQTESGKLMGIHGYYGQYGFQKNANGAMESDMNNFTDELNQSTIRRALGVEKRFVTAALPRDKRTRYTRRI